MVGTGRGAVNGILLKSAEAIETAGSINTIVLDKTGTVTTGKPTVTDIVTVNGADVDEVLTCAASLEKLSEHPLGAAIVQEAENRNITPVTITNFAQIPGQGITGIMEGGLPQDKELEIRRLQEQGKKVAMVGDGINDAPALARADVGIAIGAGTDIAVESADVVLMKSDLLDVVSTIQLSKAVMRNIKQNLFWAFFYNSMGIPIAAGVFYGIWGITLNPMIAAAAMSFSSVSVVTNALRLRLFMPKHKFLAENTPSKKFSRGHTQAPFRCNGKGLFLVA